MSSTSRTRKQRKVSSCWANQKYLFKQKNLKISVRCTNTTWLVHNLLTTTSQFESTWSRKTFTWKNGPIRWSRFFSKRYFPLSIPLVRKNYWIHYTTQHNSRETFKKKKKKKRIRIRVMNPMHKRREGKKKWGSELFRWGRNVQTKVLPVKPRQLWLYLFCWNH